MAANRISFDKQSASALLQTLIETNGDTALIAKLSGYLQKQIAADSPAAAQQQQQQQQQQQESPAAESPAQQQESPAQQQESPAQQQESPESPAQQQESPDSPAQQQESPAQQQESPDSPAQQQESPESPAADSPAAAQPGSSDLDSPDSPAAAQPGSSDLDSPAAAAAADSIDLAALPEYVSQNGEVDTVLTAVKAGLNIGLRGGAGCGKTHLVQSIAKTLGCPLYEIVCDGGTQREDVIGSRGYDGTQTYWIDGTATRALRHSKTAHVILYIDEPTCLRDDVQSALYPIMDDRRHIVLPENNGEIVQAARSINGQPGLTVISSWNDGYRGTAALNEAFQDRYDVGLTLDYLPQDRESKLLQSRTGIDAVNADVITGIAARLREAMRDKQIVTPISTRALIAYATLVKAGFSLRSAGEHTLVEKASGLFETERTVIRDVIHTATNGEVSN